LNEVWCVVNNRRNMDKPKIFTIPLYKKHWYTGEPLSYGDE